MAFLLTSLAVRLADWLAIGIDGDRSHAAGGRTDNDLETLAVGRRHGHETSGGCQAKENSGKRQPRREGAGRYPEFHQPCAHALATERGLATLDGGGSQGDGDNYPNIPEISIITEN